jgi:hypothetical protein
MKYLLISLLIVSSNVYAKCTIQTIVIDGKIMTCVVCPNYTTCN